MPALRALVVDGVTYTIDGGGGGSDPAESITYSQLVAKRNNGELVPGVQYRITDYETKIIGYYNLSSIGGSGYLHWGGTAGHAFDVIVTADAPNKLNENARAALHSGDTYFSGLGAKPETWELKYSLDNDTTRFAWADSTNGKGVIWWMKDEHGNEAGYDFKNVRFLRYALSLATSQATYTVADRGMVYSPSQNPSRYGTPVHVYMALNAYASTGSYVNPFSIKQDGSSRLGYDYDFAVGATILNSISSATIDSSYLSTYNADFYYTFDYDDLAMHKDASSNMTLFQSGQGAENNKLDLDGDMLSCVALNSWEKLGIGMHCFQSNSVSQYGAVGNHIEMWSWCSTFGGGARSNHISQGSTCNLFASTTNNNTLEQGCSLNILGTNCGSNTFKNGSSYNSLGIACVGNVFDEKCENNYLLNGCDGNKFGQSCENNLLKDQCTLNGFGGMCISNTCNTGFSSNELMFGCYGNNFSGQNIVAAAIGICRGLNIQASNINCLLIGDFVNNITVSPSKITTTGRWALVSYAGTNDATSTTAVLLHQTGYNQQSAEQTTNGGQSWTPVS